MALLPDFWWPFGPTVTLTQNADPNFRKHGPFSAHVTGNAEVFPNIPQGIAFKRADGITTSPFRVVPTAIKPNFSFQVALWVVAGEVRIELWDVTGPKNGTGPLVIWPGRESGSRATTSIVGEWVENLGIANGEDHFAAGTQWFQVAFLCELDSTDFYAGASMLTQTAGGVETFFEGRASNLLWLAGNDHLSAFNDTLDREILAGFDLTELDPAAYPSEALTIGGDGRIFVPALGRDITRRIVGLEFDLVDEEVKVGLTLETEENFLSRQLAATERKRRQLVFAPPEQASIPANVPDAIARLTPEALQIRVIPPVGHYKIQARIQGPGATADLRWESGSVIGSELGTVVEIPVDALPQGPLDLAVKSLGYTGRECRVPFEIDAVDTNAIGGSWRMPIDEQLVLYWALEEQGEPALPPVCVTDNVTRTRYDTGPYGNHGYIYSWDFGEMMTTEPGFSGLGLQHSDPDSGTGTPNGCVVVDSAPSTVTPAPDDQQDFYPVHDITIAGCFRPWLGDPDTCFHSNYDLWGRWHGTATTINGEDYDAGGFFFGLGEVDLGGGAGFEPTVRMRWTSTVSDPSAGTTRWLYWPFDWTFGQWDARRGATDYVLQDIWIFVCQRIVLNSGGSVDVDVFLGDCHDIVLNKLDPTSVIDAANPFSAVHTSAYGVDPIAQNLEPTTRWALASRSHWQFDRDDCLMSSDGIFALYDEHRRWNLSLSDAEIYGLFLHVSGQKPADGVFKIP